LVCQVAIGSRRVAIGLSSCNWFASSCNWSVKLQLVQLRSCNRGVCAFAIQNAPGCILVSPYIYIYIYDACDEYCDIYDACDEYYGMHIMPVNFRDFYT
jgi:hypothetical protein